jgi:hypothetical protein
MSTRRNKKKDPQMPVPTNAAAGDSKATKGSDVFPFWKMGHSTAIRDLVGEKELSPNDKSDKLDSPAATTTTTDKSKDGSGAGAQYLKKKQRRGQACCLSGRCAVPVQ